MESSKSLRNKLKENYEGLALLEAIDAFDQIRSLVVEGSEKRPCLAKESLLQLFQLILTIIREGCLEVSDESKIYRLLDIIEEDVYRVLTMLKSSLIPSTKFKPYFLVPMRSKKNENDQGVSKKLSDIMASGQIFKRDSQLKS